jgi:hypothetical protein
MSEAKVLIMRPREQVFAHIVRIMLEEGLPGPVGAEQFPPSSGGGMWSRRRGLSPRPPAPTMPGGPTLPGDPGTLAGPTFGVYLTESSPPETLSFEHTPDPAVTIAGRMSFRELPGGTSVTLIVETRSGAGGIQALAARAINKTMGGMAARSLLDHLKHTIDNLPAQG